MADDTATRLTVVLLALGVMIVGGTLAPSAALLSEEETFDGSRFGTASDWDQPNGENESDNNSTAQIDTSSATNATEINISSSRERAVAPDSNTINGTNDSGTGNATTGTINESP
ncbi:hypothetical protein HTG_02290 [Natrinema mahii]|nr:hypothetical protein HTG_02290 [Natrinema mahii]